MWRSLFWIVYAYVAGAVYGSCREKFDADWKDSRWLRLTVFFVSTFWLPMIPVILYSEWREPAK